LGFQACLSQIPGCEELVDGGAPNHGSELTHPLRVEFLQASRLQYPIAPGTGRLDMGIGIHHKSYSTLQGPYHGWHLRRSTQRFDTIVLP
jgi:hypothetical protein